MSKMHLKITFGKYLAHTMVKLIGVLKKKKKRKGKKKPSKASTACAKHLKVATA